MAHGGGPIPAKWLPLVAVLGAAVVYQCYSSAGGAQPAAKRKPGKGGGGVNKRTAKKKKQAAPETSEGGGKKKKKQKKPSVSGAKRSAKAEKTPAADGKKKKAIKNQKETAAARAAEVGAAHDVCRCGNQFMGDSQFCKECGGPRQRARAAQEFSEDHAVLSRREAAGGVLVQEVQLRKAVGSESTFGLVIADGPRPAPATVRSVDPHSFARAAGIEPGWVVVAVNGGAVTSKRDIVDTLRVATLGASFTFEQPPFHEVRPSRQQQTAVSTHNSL